MQEARSGAALAACSAIAREARAVDEALRRRPAVDVAFDAASWEPRAIALAREKWAARARAEHRSVGVFAALAAQLVEASGDLDAQLVVLRMAQDEVRHAGACRRVVAALGGEPPRDAAGAAPPLARHEGAPAEERVLRNVLYTTSLSEMVAVAWLVDELDATRDPYLREATRRILADEVLHGQFGFHYLEAQRPWLDANEPSRARIERYLRHAFAILEQELAPAPASCATPTDDALALGVVDPERRRAIFHATVEQAIVPGLERLGLAAGASWRTRARLA